MTLAEARGRKVPFLAKGVGEVAVVTVAKVEGKIGKVPRAGGETFGGCQTAQACHVATKAQTSYAVKDTGKMES